MKAQLLALRRQRVLALDKERSRLLQRVAEEVAAAAQQAGAQQAGAQQAGAQQAGGSGGASSGGGSGGGSVEAASADDDEAASSGADADADLPRRSHVPRNEL